MWKHERTVAAGVSGGLRRRPLGGIFCWSASLFVCFGVSALGSPLPVYQDLVQPVLEKNCVECHNPEKKKGGLDLSTFHGLARGGINGLVVREGEPELSPLVSVLHPDADPHMPPKGQLDESQMNLISGWVAGLAPDSLAALRNVRSEISSPGEPRTDVGAESSWTPPDGWSASEVADRWVDVRLENVGVRPAPVADDLTFLRRIWLDLNGTLPDREAVESFLFDGSPDKRSRVVDELLDRPEFGVHMREIFDGVLMGRRGTHWEDRRRQNQWFDYLESAFNQNRPWNEVVGEIIEARPGDGGHRGAVWFLYERENNHQAMAEAVAPLAFGTQMKCAQCHDHPLAHEIKQSHYWALVAAFNRSKNVDSQAGPGLAESAIGGFLEFANLKKETQPARLDFFNGIFIPEDIPGADEKPEDSPDLYLIPPAGEKEKPERPSRPHFSRRSGLAEAVSERENLLVGKAMVNRLWAHMLGRGLVHPVDEINSFHPASHPELLEWLSQEFAERRFDVKWLIRAIAGTRCYQRARPADQAALQDPSLFAGAIEKPLSAETLWRIFIEATGNQGFLDSSDVPDEIRQLRERMIEFFPDLFPVEFNVSLQQAMFLSNAPQVQFLLERRPGNLVDRLMEMDSAIAIIRQAFRSVLFRNPDSEELDRCRSFLEERQDNQERAVGYMIWALLNTPEFMMNP